MSPGTPPRYLRVLAAIRPPERGSVPSERRGRQRGGRSRSHAALCSPSPDHAAENRPQPLRQRLPGQLRHVSGRAAPQSGLGGSGRGGSPRLPVRAAGRARLWPPCSLRAAERQARPRGSILVGLCCPRCLWESPLATRCPGITARGLPRGPVALGREGLRPFWREKLDGASLRRSLGEGEARCCLARWICLRAKFILDKKFQEAWRVN